MSNLLRHPARKRSVSLFLQPRSPHGATKHRQLSNLLTLQSTLKQTTRGYWLKTHTKTQLLTKNHVTLSQILIIQYFFIHKLVLTK